MNLCPCEFGEVEPCHPDCSCINPYSSRGCIRCTKHGSYQQRLKHAKWLATAIDEYVEKQNGKEGKERET